MERDPVCGMEISKTKAAGTSAYKGKVYHFCSPSCKRAFDKEPEKYLGNGEVGSQHQH